MVKRILHNELFVFQDSSNRWAWERSLVRYDASAAFIWLLFWIKHHAQSEQLPEKLESVRVW